VTESPAAESPVIEPIAAMAEALAATTTAAPGPAAPARGTGPEVTLYGIRHHGPGSARALVRALDETKPDLILVEGPPEADPLVALAAGADLVPPVALLAYATKETEGRSASFWPFAVFSPEWQAIRWAVDHGVPLRFMDLPAAHSLARAGDADTDTGAAAAPRDVALHVDPLGELARAAGYEDAERWWDDVIEHRRDGSPFEAIAEAMTAVREATAVPHEPDRDDVREAHMRTVLRAAKKEGHGRIAVVCGAWHVPALVVPFPPASADAALLKGLAKVPVAMTWVPWTHGRLASATGYGAGVTSPGWYHHLFTATDRVVERWLVGVAGVLRAEDLPISSAHVIEATRLAEALAVLRGRPVAGLGEVTEATRSVLCDGDDVRVEFVTQRLVIGDRLGAVPADTPSVPLVADLAASQRRLKLPPEALARDLELDLRKPGDLDRSRLLHRLRLLGVDWGTPADTARRSKGTFWESWHLVWAPELAVDLIAAGAYGTTVVTAATAKAVEAAAKAPTLGDVTALVERCLLADLPGAIAPVLDALHERVALDADVAHLMDSLPALARSLRYGDVRGTNTHGLDGVVAGLVTRVCVGLPVACNGLDDDAAAAMRDRVGAVHAALGLLTDAPELRASWMDTLDGIARRDDLHGLLAGRFCRLLRDDARLDAAEIELRMGRTLTIGVPPATAAAWVEGFLSGGGLLLVHDEGLLKLVDGWLAAIPADTFTDVLPLLRRTFATFAAPERRAIGERARHLGSGRPLAAGDDGDDLDGFDLDRAMRVVPTLALILGGAE
jgi:hypothetical protein